LTHDWDYLHRTYFGRTVSAFAFAGGAIDLDELGEVAAVVQGVADRGTVRLEAVCGDLEPSSRRAVAKSFDDDIMSIVSPESAAMPDFRMWAAGTKPIQRLRHSSGTERPRQFDW
jgi:hypothetical protein